MVSFADIPNITLNAINVFPEKIYNELLAFFIIVASSFIIAKIALVIARKISSRTKSEVDDALYARLSRPVTLIITSFGLFLGLSLIEPLAAYSLLIKRFFSIFFMLLLAVIIIRTFKVFIENYFLKIQKGVGKKSRLDNTVAPIVENIFSFVIYLFAFIFILQIFSIQLTPIIASLGVASLAVALALQDTLSNFFAGLYIVTERPVNVGDYIKLENGEEGYVEKISWRNSTIRTLPGNRVVIPNSLISKVIVTNYYYPSKEMAVVFQCGVAYGSDLEKVEKVTVDVAKKILNTVQGGDKNFEPFIRYHTLGDSNIQFSIILRVNEFTDKFLVTHEFIKNLTKAYEKNNIEISWPVRKIYHGDKK